MRRYNFKLLNPRAFRGRDMPTYAYQCTACGHASDEWLKMSEATSQRVCPACGQDAYLKQVTAAAFQLKGGGWYVTDFRNGAAGAAKSEAKPDAKPAEPAACPACPAAGAGGCAAASPDAA